MLIKRKYLFGTTILAGVVAVAAPAFAQSQLPSVTVQGQRDQDATTIEEVVVTGSRIRRDPTNTPTPIISVSRDDLINTGQNSVIDYLATIPALSNSRVPSDTVDVFTQGVGLLGIAAPNLRSLGAGRTLTLIDGKRQVGSVGGSLQVDIDTIPRLLIENIEIVTGGASSVYGADAVSGVLNFILRKDFEGLEVDLNAAQINQGGQASYRASVLGGVNLLDDRLNLWGFAEYEHVDPIKSLDLDWMEDSYGLVAIDADPTAAPNDGNIDSALFSGLRTLGRLPWGQTTLANSQPGSQLNNPLVPDAPCNLTSTSGYTSANCYAVNPGKTFIYDGATARLANFGQRIGNTGLSRALNIGGDGFNPNGLTFEDRTPEQTSQRYAAGANFAIASNVMLSVEAKYVTEDSFANSQAVFFDVLLNDARNPANRLNRWWVDTQTPGYNTFDLRYSDNAFLPQNVKDAITANVIQNYSAPTQTAPGAPTTTAAAPYARHSLFGPQRGQDQNRELQRYMVSLTGDFDQLAFVKNINWEASYVYGELDNVSIEDSVDVERFRLAADAVRDTGGVVNGVVNQIVCRSQVLLNTPGAPIPLPDMIRGGDMRNNPSALAAINQCKPLNIFGAGNQSAEALAYVRDPSLQTVRERNEQEQAIAVVSGELWDFTGAGPIGIAIGAEYRREFTEASGRDDQDDLFLFGLQGPDFLGAEYESEEAFAELSIPLFRDSWLGEYAELSGSYRYFDYTTAGTGDVYGVNLVYRPIRDIGFKTSYNTSFRAPNLGENFSPLSQTFSNGFVDPCTTANITAPGTTAEVRANRIRNCEALAVQRGYTAGFFDFSGATPTTQDDYVQNSTSVVGLSGGNIALQPETSESFTFTTVLEPRFFPNFSLVLDYYEIRIDNVISAVTVNQAAALCVDTASLGPACSTIFRNSPFQAGNTNAERSAGFQLGGASGSDPGFIQGSVNFAAAQTRGLDFTANYSIDTEELLGRNWGRLNYSLRGNWLIEQKQFNNPALPSAFTEFASNPGSPRVRLTSSLTWAPTDSLSINWTADWQTGQDNTRIRDIIANGNLDNRLYEYYSTGDFTRHDFTVRYQVNDQVSVRTGVTNAFDAEQPRFLGGTLQDNYDPYGTRFFVGLNYRPW